ncbi:MAG: hypothetical protein JNJ77_04995 [Planctomycetia bacterium]|nr:hypothetical protein [Planctomycetia bacterium]
MSNWYRLLASGCIIVLCWCLGNPRLHPPLLAQTPRDEPKVKVLVPMVDIEPYQRVQDSTKFRLMEFPTHNTITSFDQIKGKVSRYYKLSCLVVIFHWDDQ